MGFKARYQRTILVRYKAKQWHYGLSHLWYRYHKKMFGSFIIRGLKIKAYNNFSKLLFLLKKKEKIEPRYLFLISCMRMTARLAIKEINRGSRVIHVPVALTKLKQIALAIKSLFKPLRDNHKRRNAKLNKIFELLSLSLRNQGNLIENKQEIYKLARINKRQRVRRFSR